jgi:hypothetical protein
MVELTHEISLPMRGWECGNCGEPYNSERQPNQHMCMACREETIWELPQEARAEITDRLANANEGDEVAIVPDHAGSMKGIVTETEEGRLVLDGDGDGPVIAYDTGDEPETPKLSKFGEDPDLGDDIFHVEVTPAEDVEIDTRVTKRVKTPINDIVHVGASNVGLDPDTVEVEGVRMVDGELELKLRGEA